MANKLTTASIEGTGNPFVGQGDLVMFDAIADYSNKTLAALKNPKSLGQIVQDSTSWDGDDVETSQIKDEQGNLITAKVTAGTLAFSFELASTSREMVQKFMNGSAITGALGSGSAVGSAWTGSKSAVGFGTELPVLNHIPLAIVNDDQSRAWIFPNCKIASNLSYSDGLWRIKCSVTAEAVNEANLKTGMIIDAA